MGAGNLRHINVSSLWIQEKQDAKELMLRKVLGTENPADMMTKHLPRQALDKCMGRLSEYQLAWQAKAGFDAQGNKTSETKLGGAPGEPPSELNGVPSEPRADGVSPSGPVPRVCMDYFYESSRPESSV